MDWDDAALVLIFAAVGIVILAMFIKWMLMDGTSDE